MKVVKEREGAIVRRVHLLGDNGEPIAAVTRFLDHLAERGCSPYTLCAYAYDLLNLFIFLAGEELAWQAFRPADAVRFLAFLRRRPSQRSAQRLGLSLIAGGDAPGRRLSASTVNRILAGVASFSEWAIAAEAYSGVESPLQLREDPALARVADRHQPVMGRASRQRPVRRVVAVKQPLRLPRPMPPADIEALLRSLTRQSAPLIDRHPKNLLRSDKRQGTSARETPSKGVFCDASVRSNTQAAPGCGERPDNSLDGRYSFSLPEPLLRGELRSLRNPNDPAEQVFDLLAETA